jgi:hypothetical protein
MKPHLGFRRTPGSFFYIYFFGLFSGTESNFRQITEVNLSDFYSYRLIEKLTAFLQLQEFSQHNQTWGHWTPIFPRVAFSSMLKSKYGNILDKGDTLRITLHLDGSSITCQSHTHPSHSQTSRLLTSSLDNWTNLTNPRDVHIPFYCSICGIYTGSCLLLIDKVRTKDKTYIWVSVWWKTKT